MNSKIIGIGNAIVDILCKSDESFLEENNLLKGSMSLIDNATANQFLEIKSEKISCGGSASNTIAALSQLGVGSSFIGKVGGDELGQKFISEIEKTNTRFIGSKNRQEDSAKSFVFVTPDAQRTMCTFLGCASQIDENDINDKIFENAQILYLEGYLWDSPSTIEALKKAIELAKKNNVKIAFSLSDSFCVSRHKDDFIKLIKNDLDILFANEAEALELDNNFKEILQTNNNLIAAITKSDKGCEIFYNNKSFSVDAQKISSPTDTTGAGDCFAAGFLYGIVNDFTLEKSANFGNIIASQIIQKFGARFDNEELQNIKNALV